MNEIILLYNFENTKIGDAIETLLKQLGVTVKHIQKEEVNHPLGYLLGIEGFEAGKPETKEMKEEMLVIHNFSDKQINVMLELFKSAKIPFIPLKAVVTEKNVFWPFSELHEHVKEEYEMMANINNK